MSREAEAASSSRARRARSWTRGAEPELRPRVGPRGRGSLRSCSRKERARRVKGTRVGVATTTCRRSACCRRHRCCRGPRRGSRGRRRGEGRSRRGLGDERRWTWWTSFLFVRPDEATLTTEACGCARSASQGAASIRNAAGRLHLSKAPRAQGVDRDRVLPLSGRRRSGTCGRHIRPLGYSDARPRRDRRPVGIEGATPRRFRAIPRPRFRGRDRPAGQ